MLVSVIIPTKNEREAISGVITATQEALRGYSHEIIVIDKSSDDTAALAAQAGALVINQRYSGGVGAALREAFSYAQGNVVVTLDGDGTYDPADIPRMIEPILNGDADFVNGNRLNGRRQKGAVTPRNLAGNKILTWLGNISFGTRVNDSQSGMKAVRRDLLERMSLFESGFPICSELIAEAVRSRARMTEVSIAYLMRKGETKLSPTRDGGRILWATVSLTRDHNPLLLYGGLGSILVLLGALVSVPVVAEYVDNGTFHFIGRALITVIFVMTGLFSIFTGVTLNTVNFSIRRLESRIFGTLPVQTRSALGGSVFTRPYRSDVDVVKPLRSSSEPEERLE